VSKEQKNRRNVGGGKRNKNCVKSFITKYTAVSKPLSCVVRASLVFCSCYQFLCLHNEV
jgi:hypothetical protein